MSGITLKQNGTKTDLAAGCDFIEIEISGSIHRINVIYVKVTDVSKIAQEFTNEVLNTSWIQAMNTGVQRSYQRTVDETAAELVGIFQSVGQTTEIQKDFGEILVSMGSGKALQSILLHFACPLAELWKPQKKQNEGFDFHTVCGSDFINFGEAKFSSNGNAYSNSISQAQSFIEQEKHLRDRVHLVNLVNQSAISNLDGDNFGVVAAFSINAQNPLLVLTNAVDAALAQFDMTLIKSLYLVGVSH